MIDTALSDQCVAEARLAALCQHFRPQLARPSPIAGLDIEKRQRRTGSPGGMKTRSRPSGLGLKWESMLDMQLYLVLAIGPVSTLVIVMFGVFLNNQRLNDVRDLLRAEMKVLESHMQLNHSEMLQRFGDLDNRMTRIENHFKLN
ncbi:MAG: hypothetical protein NTW28_00120 [Candidatus Solibacter sp.]|nr:hypothetical protein [Candidatus Solibacter sp.]